MEITGFTNKSIYYLLNATNYTVPTTSPQGEEGFIVIIVGIICSLGNFSCIFLIACHRRFRKSKVVILCHHCFLDFLKSLYCFPYGYSLLTSLPVPHCNWIGSSYVFIVTTSAYNMMALVVNHEYDVMFPQNREDDGSCVIFGVFIIWLMSFLLNLGISIIPSNTVFNQDIGVCLFLYGCNYSYILHVLWILLVTVAVSSSLFYFCRMKRKLLHHTECNKWTKIHESFKDEFERMLDFNIKESTREQTHIQRTLLSHLHTTRLLIAIVVSFIIFWYPLFTLTIFDFHFQVSPLVYRLLTILSWIHPITTPVFCSLILRDMEFKGYTLRDLSSNLMPLQRISTRRYHYENADAFNFNCDTNGDNENNEHSQSLCNNDGEIAREVHFDTDSVCQGFENQHFTIERGTKVTSIV